MLSKKKISFIVSLQKKKAREEHRLFIIEGDKLVREFLSAGQNVKTLVAKPGFVNSLPPAQKQEIDEIIPCSYEELKRISSMKTPHNALAVVEMPEMKTDPEAPGQKLSVALDFIQDPGNLGTIVRAAAWFGIRNIYCSENCVDIFNPKAIQASMGAILHVRVAYTDLHSLFRNALRDGIKIYGATLDGNSIYSVKLENRGIIFFGNESRGISDELSSYITDKIMIPSTGRPAPGIDSLNVGMAASVIFSEFTRNISNRE
ncbi:MAG: RNA methyltransferase [Bacteroidales bacterium]|nr:RNA methyltransferase [Bacteroidales bacterium]